MHREVRDQVRRAGSDVPPVVAVGQERVIVEVGCAVGGASVGSVRATGISESWVLGGGSALPRLGLVEHLRDHQLPVLLLHARAEMVLVHYPVGLLRLPLLAVVGVQHQYLLEALQPAAGEHRLRLAGLVPPGLAAEGVRVDLSPFPGPRRVGFRGAVEEVPDVAVFGHTCSEMVKRSLQMIRASSIWDTREKNSPSPKKAEMIWRRE